jgi:hypothetical protein
VPNALDAIERGVSFVERHGDATMLSRAKLAAARAFGYALAFDRAASLFDEGERLLGGDPVALRAVLVERATYLRRRGLNRAAKEVLDRIDGDPVDDASALQELCTRAVVAAHVGGVDLTRRLLDHALRVVPDDAGARARLAIDRATVAFTSGDDEGFVACSLEGAEHARAAGLPWIESAMLAYAALGALGQRRFADALDLATRAAALSSEHGFDTLEEDAYAAYARFEIDGTDPSLALRRALNTWQEEGYWWCITLISPLRARVILAAEGADAARAYARDALALAERVGQARAERDLVALLRSLDA